MAPWWLRDSSDELADGAVEEAVAEVTPEPTDGAPTDAPEPAPEAPEPPPVDPAEETRLPKKRRRRRRRPAQSEAAPREPSEEVQEPSPSAEGTDVAESEATTGIESLAKEILYALPQQADSAASEKKMALFCDLENIAIGVKDSEIKSFEIQLVLERLVEKGKIIVKKAYADWERYSEYKKTFHEAAIELIDIPQKYYSGKNSADIRMVVDAMDLCYAKEHLDTFVILSGDSDFSPLVSKLKENNKFVIGMGVKGSSSNLLISNCDEFIYYEDVWRDAKNVPPLDHLSKKEAEVFGLLIDAMLALIRETKEVLWGSMIKQTMQRKRPSFNEGYYGYGSFSELLEDAERKKIIELQKDKRSGSYVVAGFARDRQR